MIKSVTKRKLTQNKIQLMVKESFGQSAKALDIIELTDGYFNNSYKLNLNSGLTTVLKVAPPPLVDVLTYEKHLMNAEIYTLKHMKNLALLVPEVLFYDPTLRIIDSEYFFMDYLEGIPLNKVKADLSTIQLDLLSKELGEQTYRMRQINDGYFGEIGNKSKRFKNWYDCFYTMVEDLILDAEKISFSLPFAKDTVLKIVEQHKASLDNIQKPALLHKDLWDGNVFIDKKTFQLIGIIDTERAIFGDPLMEIVCGFYKDNKAFVSSYYGKTQMYKDEKQRILLYQLYLYLLMYIECPYRQYEDPDREKYLKEKLVFIIQQLT